MPYLWQLPFHLRECFRVPWRKGPWTGQEYQDSPCVAMRGRGVGYNSLYGSKIADCIGTGMAPEIRLRVAVRTQDRANAMKMYNDFDSVYTNGPSGGGGATMKVSEIISVFSCFVDRADVTQNVEYEVI